MNLAVHGLEGDIQRAITYYEDPHELLGKADYVMANPPFNVDEIDADRVKTDPRLPFGLPGVNKKQKVGNGNYVWISYFYSYLNEAGRAGFVMSSQASSAGGGEAAVRRKLVETGDVDVMVAIRPNFFYTRTVPCELWFLNRAKPERHRDNVLMIDARNVYRKVTRKIYDFSPEQHQNPAGHRLALPWGHGTFSRSRVPAPGGRGGRGSGLLRVGERRRRDLPAAAGVSRSGGRAPQRVVSVPEDATEDRPARPDSRGFRQGAETIRQVVERFRTRVNKAIAQWDRTPDTNAALNKLADQFAPLAETSRDLADQADQLYKLAARLIETCENECGAKSSDVWNGREITRARKAADEARRHKPLSSSNRCATSGARPAGSPSVSPKRSCATSRGWSSWWTAPRSRPTTGA